MTQHTQKYPPDNPKWKPFLRKHFWVRKHFRGYCICWHTWRNYCGWGVSWGPLFNSIQEAKAVRRFLNRKVTRGMNYGLPFSEVVAFVRSGSEPQAGTGGQYHY